MNFFLVVGSGDLLHFNSEGLQGHVETIESMEVVVAYVWSNMVASPYFGLGRGFVLSVPTVLRMQWFEFVPYDVILHYSMSGGGSEE